MGGGSAGVEGAEAWTVAARPGEKLEEQDEQSNPTLWMPRLQLSIENQGGATRRHSRHHHTVCFAQD